MTRACDRLCGRDVSRLPSTARTPHVPTLPRFPRCAGASRRAVPAAGRLRRPRPCRRRRSATCRPPGMRRWASRPVRSKPMRGSTSSGASIAARCPDGSREGPEAMLAAVPQIGPGAAAADVRQSFLPHRDRRRRLGSRRTGRLRGWQDTAPGHQADRQHRGLESNDAAKTFGGFDRMTAQAGGVDAGWRPPHVRDRAPGDARSGLRPCARCAE